MKGKHSVALLIETSTHWGREIIAGVLQYVQEGHPWNLSLEPWGMEEHMALAPDWHGDGVIACVRNPETLAAMRRRRIPIVDVSSIEFGGSAPFPRVITDQRASAALAASFFADRNFRYVAYFGIARAYADNYERAFRQECQARAMVYSNYAVLPGHGASPQVYIHRKRLIRWLSSLPKPVGILTWNAVSAREVIYAAAEAGMLVPEDIAVLSGAEDELFCEVPPVTISGIRSPLKQIGRHAAAMLERLMGRSGRRVRDEAFKPQGIVERLSTDTLNIRDTAVLKALHLIRSQAAERIGVAEVARASGLSRRMLEIRFSRELRRTIAQEIRRCHLARACELLEKTMLPISAVAERSGFSSPERMTTVFHRVYGQTPLRYRRQRSQIG